jgi:hypothetical protein
MLLVLVPVVILSLVFSLSFLEFMGLALVSLLVFGGIGAIMERLEK